MRMTAALVIATAGALAAWQALPSFAQEGIAIPAPALDAPACGATETAVLAGGCFWGVQGVFQHLAGVKNAVSGYAGGAAETAHYRVVGSGRTGHAEAVEVVYDPSQISYGEILQVFFSVAHDPTELNRQGPDVGTQYRSTIFPLTRPRRRSPPPTSPSSTRPASIASPSPPPSSPARPSTRPRTTTRTT